MIVNANSIALGAPALREVVWIAASGVAALSARTVDVRPLSGHEPHGASERDVDARVPGGAWTRHSPVRSRGPIAGIVLLPGFIRDCAHGEKSVDRRRLRCSGRARVIHDAVKFLAGRQTPI